MNDASKRRFPKVLADQVSLALHATRPLGVEESMKLLAQYRENHRQAFANGGLNPDFKGIGDGIPNQWFQAIMMLDEAFAALHEYRSPGGADLYLAEQVYREAQRVTSRLKRSSTADHESIKNEAKRLGYYELPKFSRHKNDILDAIIKNLGLYKDNKSTSCKSSYRNLKRIIDS